MGKVRLRVHIAVRGFRTGTYRGDPCQFVDLGTHKTIFVCEGKDASTFKRFLAWFEEHGGFAEQITLVAMDMSTAFLSGCMTYLPKAQIVYDKFHIIQEANKVLDEVRKMELYYTRIQTSVMPIACVKAWLTP